MITISIRWSGEEGIVKYSQDFEDSYPVLKADMLRDALWELEKKYNEVLKAGLVNINV